MTKHKVTEVLGRYASFLAERGVHSRQLEEGEYSALAEQLNPEVVYGHLLYMCEVGSEHADSGRLEKSFRWLGFIQGALWMLSVFPINDLKEHSRPLPK